MLFAVAVFAACSGDEPAPVDRGPVARFALTNDVPNLLDVPFPSDVYLDAGHVRDPLPGLERIVPGAHAHVGHDLARNNGFSRIALAHFYVDEAGSKSDVYDGPKAADIDPSSLPVGEVACASPASSVFLVDLEAEGDAARIPCRAYVHFDTDRSVSRPNLAVGPAHGALLAPHHRYAAVLTSRVVDRKGMAIEASADFEAVRRGDTTTPTRALYAEAYRATAARLDPLLGTARVVAIAPFTTEDEVGELVKMRNALDAEPVPKIGFDAAALAPMAPIKFTSDAPLPAGFAASLDDYLGVVPPSGKLPSGVDDSDGNRAVRAHDQIRVVATVAIDATTFLSVPAGTTSANYSDPDFATFVKNANGDFTPQGKERIWISLTIPKAPMPKDGYPVIFFAHGLEESRHAIFQIANVYAEHGWMTACIDSITFGARSRDPRKRIDVTTDYAKSAAGAKYDGPDGIADADARGNRQDALDLFGGFVNLGAARDQLRQSALDMVEVVRALALADLTPLSPDGSPIKVDGARMGYQGNSLGSVEGAAFAAIEPRIRSFALGVVGGALATEIGSGGPVLSKLLTAGAAVQYDVLGDFVNASHPITSLVQSIVDPGDPIVYAPHLVRDPLTVGGTKLLPRNLLVTEVLYDDYIPNEANEAFHRAAGIGVALPNAGSNAEILDVRDLSKNPNRIRFLDVEKGSDGRFHDSPFAGTTAIVIQLGPAGHGDEFGRSSTGRYARIPYANFASMDPFDTYPVGSARPRVKNPYHELQAILGEFFRTTFEGGVPSFPPPPPPVRDFDGDGILDADDPDPSTPSSP